MCRCRRRAPRRGCPSSAFLRPPLPRTSAPALGCVVLVSAGDVLLRESCPETRKNKMKELVSNSTTSISQARKAVEQLKMEAYMDRMKVSKAAADLLAYCDAHIGEDPLIIPVPASENPFREKKLFCTIL
ncbi:guanine nucleotide-binding protein G(I)/G(S)/G(O) subunit gamma-4 isoform X1 [Pithys albifrons albifrons]|uniref:guanine nucleotide-binding protein G(I)/G(S)/G(O) subunit gamma-4 isoform X1 n=1 Tax=Pithys albifrons albifrons TaxID=3385563 RepID=UPI003A5CFEB3